MTSIAVQLYPVGDAAQPDLTAAFERIAGSGHLGVETAKVLENSFEVEPSDSPD
jgi:hypothetical protein